MNGIQKAFYRTFHVAQLPHHKCPKCGQSLIQIHRNWFEKRILSIFITRLQRYSCSNPNCKWEGRVVFTK